MSALAPPLEVFFTGWPANAVPNPGLSHLETFGHHTGGRAWRLRVAYMGSRDRRNTLNCGS